MIVADMKNKLHFGWVAVCLLIAPATAEESFDCKKLDGPVLRIYRDVGEPLKKTPNPLANARKGVIVADEQRELLADFFKPEGSVGGVIPYKRAQIFFGRYMFEGREKMCTTQRHEDVFAAGEQSQHYMLRCLNDADGNGQFETFRRFVELVRYDSRTGQEDAATGTPQIDLPLVSPIKLVPADGAKPVQNELAVALRSTIQVSGISKNTVTLQSISTAGFSRFETSLRGDSARARSVTIEVPLVDESIALVNGTKVNIRRVTTGWEVSARSGIVNSAKLICGGTALDTGQAIIAFGNGGIQTIVRSSDAQ